MKKLTLSLIVVFALLSVITTELKAETETTPVPVTTTTDAESAKDNADLARLNEIKAMDMSTLSRSEKKELRNEVREIKEYQDGRGRGYQDGRGRGYQSGHGRRNHDGGDRGYEGRRGGDSMFYMSGSGLIILLLIILLI
jgi:hypothetical protein